MRVLLTIELPYACYGIYVKDSGGCSDAPPMAHWMRGKPVSVITAWVQTKGGKIYAVDEVTEPRNDNTPLTPKL